MESNQEDAIKRGRPVKEEKKLSRSINLKLTEDDYKTLKEKAESVGMKITQYARQMTLKGRIRARYTKEELDLRRKIAGMANNVNQIARKAHSEGFMKEAMLGIIILNKLRDLLDDR